MRTIFLLAVALIANTCFAQLKVDVQQFQAITAKSARIEPLADTVAVFLVDRTPGIKTGAFLTITSDYKWPTPYIDAPGVELIQSREDAKRWMMFGPAGKYRVLVIEFDPERGPKFNPVDVVIGTAPPDTPPTDPPVDPVPGDYAAITKTAAAVADQLNDRQTRARLADAYKSAVTAAVGKSYDEARTIVTTARFAALNARTGDSRLVDWDSWRRAVDAELSKIVPAGDSAKYLKAIEAIVAGLKQ